MDRKDIIKKKLREDPTLTAYSIAKIFGATSSNMTVASAYWRARCEIAEEALLNLKNTAPIDPPKVAKSVPKPVKNDWKPDDF